MNGQANSPTVSPSPMLTQPSTCVPMQTLTTANLPTNANPGTPHSAVQVWAPNPVGSFSIPTVALPRTHQSFSTLPSGHTVLMANITPTTQSQMPAPSSSPVSKPLPLTPSVGTLMVSPGNTPSPLATNQTGLTTAMFQTPGCPVPFAIPGNILPNSLIGDPSTTSASYMTMNVNQNPQFSNPNINTSVFSNQSVVNTNVLHQSSLRNSSIIHTISSQDFGATSSGTQSFLSELTSDDLPVSVSVLSDSSNSTPVISQSDSKATPISTVTPDLMSTTTQNSSKSSHLQTTPPAMQGQPIGFSPNAHNLFTPSTLTDLISDLDPLLQLDQDAHEVLVNLAKEFVTTVATDAQKVASLRDSNQVEAKDIHFCLERDWDISIPGFLSENRPFKQTAITEAHKQRLALIKKQIKKM